MSVINILLIILWGILAPFILGYQFDLIMSKERISYARCLLFGYVIYGAVFQLIAPEFIIAGRKFSTLFYLWTVIIIVIAAVIIIANRKTFVKRICEPFTALQQGVKYILSKYDWLERLCFVGAVFFIVFHTLLIGYMMHFDTDDARFVSEALEAYEKNTLLAYHPITGEFLGGPIGEMCKDVFAPYPIFLAVYSKLFGLVPAVATHTVLPFLYVPMCYMAFYLVAKQLFKNDSKSIAIALLLFGVINTFSMETNFSFGWTLLTIVWQGRSFLCVALIPLMLHLLIPYITDLEIKWYNYVILAVSGISCCMLSGMGAMLILLMIASFAFVALIIRKNIKVPLLMMVALLPTIVYFALYSTYSGRL